MMLAACAAMAVACTQDDALPGSAGGQQSGSSAQTSVLLSTFDVAIDRQTAEPTDVAEEYFPDEEDMLEPDAFTTEVAIDLSNPEAKTENGVEVTVSGGHVTANHGSTKKVCYVVSGTTENGSLTVLGDKKYAVRLEGASITNPDSAALNLLSAGRAYIILAAGTASTLADGPGGSQKGCLYCKGKLIFGGGSGSLSVTAQAANGIHSSDYIVLRAPGNIYVKSTAGHGIKGADGIFINGGILNVEVSAAAAKGINSESHIVVRGGRTTVIATGGGTYDTDDRKAKAAAALKADSTLTVKAGELWLKSTGAGGKGISTDGEISIGGGSLYIVTEGGQYKASGDTSSPKGIKADGNIDISGGRTWVRTSGYKGEGIETKNELSITGGEVASYAYDDAINSKSTMTLTGGYVYAHGRTNDGLDANGNCYIKGGTVYAICSGTPEVAIDANTEGGYKLYVEGGTIVAIGGLEQGASLSQSCYRASSWSAGTWYALRAGDSTFAFLTPQSGGSGIVVSCALQPTLLSGVSQSGGTTLFGGIAISGGSTSGGSDIGLTSYTVTGGRPGGWKW